MTLCLMLAVTFAPFGARAWGHAFIKKSEPRSEATLRAAPGVIRIWFDSPVERVYAKLHVENERKEKVDKGDARIDPQNQTMLEAGLTPLAPGNYRVVWSVVARDGHPRQGSYTFRVYRIAPTQ